MVVKKYSKLEKWREKYAALLTTLACLYTFIQNWGDNWFLTVFFGVGVIVCGTISYFDIKRTLRQNH